MTISRYNGSLGGKRNTKDAIFFRMFGQLFSLCVVNTGALSVHLALTYTSLKFAFARHFMTPCWRICMCLFAYLSGSFNSEIIQVDVKKL